MKLRLRKGGLLAAFAFTTGHAMATVVTFEDIASPGSLTTYNNAGFTTQGFDFLFVHGHVVDSAYKPGTYTFGDGSDWLMHDYSNPLYVTKNGGGVFSLKQFDYGSFLPYTTTYIATLKGHFADNTYAWLSLPLTPGVTSVSPAWSNLVKLEFVGPDNQAYDNFVFDESGTAVPEPASLALVGLGLLGFVATRRPRR